MVDGGSLENCCAARHRGFESLILRAVTDNKKTYSIGGHLIRVVMASPWTFKTLTAEQETLVETLRSGGDLGIRPVPADRWEELPENESAMGKVQMTREKWDAMGEEERDAFRHDLDMLQYAPFEIPEDGNEPLFELTVGGEEPAWLGEALATAPVVSVDETLPCYYGYRYNGCTVYAFYPQREHLAGIFVLEDGYRRGTYYPQKGFGARTTQMQLNTSLMIAFTFATAGLDTLLLHASVIRHEGAAQLFFGVSGTGKSTHSRLWLENVPGTDLMNDDNPVIRFTPAGATVYGSPWSGKTLCYRNVQAPVRALVRLEQAPENRIERLTALGAYASVIAAVSTIRWDSAVMDLLVPTVEKAATLIPCFRLGCRPDREAVEVCKNAIES